MDPSENTKTSFCVFRRMTGVYIGRGQKVGGKNDGAERHHFSLPLFDRINP